MKRATVKGTFYELSSGLMYQGGEGEGSSAKVAVARAVQTMLNKVSKLKPRKKYTTFQATFFITDVVAADDSSQGATEKAEKMQAAFKKAQTEGAAQ